MDHLIRMIMLQSIDTRWKDHLLGMDHLKEASRLRGYGQKDPSGISEGRHQMFMDMVYRIKTDTIEKLCRCRSGARRRSRKCRRSNAGLRHEPGRDTATPKT